MPNPLYNAINGNQAPTMGQPGIMQRFNLFCQQFRGDPEQTVRGLLASGQMTQGQFNQLQQAANRILNMR